MYILAVRIVVVSVINKKKTYFYHLSTFRMIPLWCFLWIIYGLVGQKATLLAYIKAESRLEWSRRCRTVATEFTLALTVRSRSALAPVKISFDGTVTGAKPERERSESASVNASTEINETIFDRTESGAGAERDRTDSVNQA